MKRRAEWLATHALLASLRYAPLPVARKLARSYAHLLDRAVPRLRRAAYRNLSFALPEANAPAITDGVFESIGRIFLTFARLPDIDAQQIHQWIRYEGLEHLRSAQAKGKGVLVATAHLGNWELSAFAHGLMTEAMSVVARPLDNSLIDEIVESRRALSGNEVILKKDAARTILRALRGGRMVGVLVDQNTAAGEGVFVPFFGVLACASPAFVRLAHHSGAPVVPGFALWSHTEQRYVLRFYPELPMNGDVLQDTARVQASIEAVIREYPDQWLWVHRRWKTRPPGEPSLY